MTTPLYRDDAYRTSCEATVLAVNGRGGIVLDQSVFYATGGGQPGDDGVIRWDGGEVVIATTVKGDGGEVVHVPAEGTLPPRIGAKVTAQINGENRALYRRIHTALHLLSVVIPLPVTGGAISALKGRLDFNMPEALDDKEALAEELNALIAGDHTVTTEWITDEALAANPGLVKTMRVKPPVGQGRVRLVRIGAGEATIDLQPCGGTHVRATAEIGRIRLGKVEKKGKENRRVNLFLED